MNEYLDYIKQGQKTELIIRTPGGAVRFFSTFEKQTDTNIIISKPENKHLAFNCIPNQDVELYAYTNGGVFKLKCKFITCLKNECLLSLPSSVDKMQRREYIRVELNIKTILTLISPDSKKTIQATSKNISAKGIKLLLEEDVSKFSKIELRMLFEEGSISTVAQIIKIRPVEIGQKTYYSTSLMFITISEKEMSFIVKKCFEFEAAQRRKLLDSES